MMGVADIKRSLSFFLALALLWGLAAFAGGRNAARQIVLAHNLDEKHPVHLGMLHFAKTLATSSQGRYQVQIFANGQLGSEREVIELLQLGAVGLTKVSSLSLEAFVPAYGVINLPYIFRDRSHYFKVLDGPIGQQIHSLGAPKQFRGLTYYDAGARNFYAHKPILTPADLKGLKMRVMGSQTAIRMLQLLGGSPTPTAYGEIYTALQQGVIDGAENNITAVTLTRHGEVAKHYSQDEHIMAPDILMVSEKLWQSLPPADQQLFKQAADASGHYQRKVWQELTQELEKQAQQELLVKFYSPDKAPFVAQVQALHSERAAENPLFADLIRRIKAE